MEHLLDFFQTWFRLALLTFWVLLEAQTFAEQQETCDDGGWSCGSHLSVEDEGLCNIQVLDGTSLSLRGFLDNYAYSRPVIITGQTQNAKFRSSCSKRNLLDEYGHLRVRLSTANTHSYKKVDASLNDYVDGVLGPQSPDVLGSDTLYFFGDTNWSEWHPLLDLYEPPAYLLPGTSRALSFGIAGPGTGVPFHWHGPGYSEVIYGRKRWFLYPPDREPHFHPNVSTLAWLRDVYPNLPRHQAPLECTIGPGQVLYFPDRWWHATLNLDTSVFISTFLG
ncbi:jmjC domain-containing protein 8 [Stigmatopora argus]